MVTKYAAIVTYVTNEKAAVVVCADGLAEAWAMVLEEFNGGECLRSVMIARVLSPAHNAERWG